MTTDETFAPAESDLEVLMDITDEIDAAAGAALCGVRGQAKQAAAELAASVAALRDWLRTAGGQAYMRERNRQKREAWDRALA